MKAFAMMKRTTFQHIYFINYFSRACSAGAGGRRKHAGIANEILLLAEGTELPRFEPLTILSQKFPNQS
jgi:hypothetical protein